MAGNGTIIPLGKITQPQTKHPKRWLATSGGRKEGQSSAVATDVQGSILTSHIREVHFGMASRLDQSLRQSLFNQTHKKFTSISPTMPIFFFSSLLCAAEVKSQPESLLSDPHVHT